MRTAKATSHLVGFLLATFLPCMVVPCAGQDAELRPPAYFLKVMEDSHKMYELNIAGADSLPKMPMADPLFRCYALVKKADGKDVLVDIMDDSTRDAESIRLLKDGERAFGEGNMIEARKNYKGYIARQPNASRVMTFLGQSFVKTEYQDSVVYWYRRAAQANPLDYMAQWFYAAALLEVDSAESAMEHMITAMILNRTNPRMYAELEYFFKSAGYTYDGWTFQPRMVIKEKDTHTVYVMVDSSESSFLPYCLCQAAWKFEPSVATAVVDTSDHYAVLVRREQECLAACLGTNLDDELLPITTHPAVIHAARALNDHDFKSYLFYEVILARRPIVAYYMTESSRAELAKYVRKYHLKKIVKR